MTTPHLSRTLAIGMIIGHLCFAQENVAKLAPPEPDRETLLSLPWQQFDQTQNSGWRIFVNPSRKEYLKVAELIEAYLDRRIDLTDAERAICRYHGAMMYVYHATAHGGDPRVALPYIKQAIVPHEAEGLSADWNDMVAATMAFLSGDREVLIEIRRRVAALPAGAAKWPDYPDDLINNLGKPYASWQKSEPKRER